MAEYPIDPSVSEMWKSLPLRIQGGRKLLVAVLQRFWFKAWMVAMSLEIAQCMVTRIIGLYRNMCSCMNLIYGLPVRIANDGCHRDDFRIPIMGTFAGPVISTLSLRACCLAGKILLNPHRTSRAAEVPLRHFKKNRIT